MAHFVAYNTANSGTPALAGNAAITPLTIQSQADAVIAGSIISDQAGTLVVAQSFDGTDYDFNQTIAVAAGVGQSFNINIIAPFVQISYTNGATPQGYMRLYARAFGNRTN